MIFVFFFLQVICSIIASITTLHKFFTPTLEVPSSSHSKFKSNIAPKETKDSKTEKNKKEFEVNEELPWKPWDLIWPKENAKGINSLPVLNSAGKYVVKLYWMVRAFMVFGLCFDSILH